MFCIILYYHNVYIVCMYICIWILYHHISRLCKLILCCKSMELIFAPHNISEISFTNSKIFRLGQTFIFVFSLRPFYFITFFFYYVPHCWILFTYFFIFFILFWSEYFWRYIHKICYILFCALLRYFYIIWV